MPRLCLRFLFALLLSFFLVACGAFGGGGGKNRNPPVTGLTATAGNGQVVLNWNPFPGTINYNVARSTTKGGECPAGCNYIAGSIKSTTYTDVGLTNGTTYYYMVNADLGPGGMSTLSNEVSATPQ